MAIHTAVRFKPDTLRSASQTMVEGFDPANIQGTVVMPVQLVAYDDASADWTKYAPGNLTYESLLTVLYEDVLRGDLNAANGATDAAILTYWTNALNAWAATLQPSVAALLRATRGARRAAPIVLS